MTPVYYNSNDYYKKMLELQRRLRRSEEERIRLEERFSLLEHESRSRHETCINRLRMRYIEFLEEQQARDERNHRLLGALDRVDSSLALISAKTDRLGTMRRQYEAASLFKNWYVTRRGNGSVAGDSGVASQTNDGRVSSLRQDRVPTFKHSTIPKVSSRNVLSVPTASTRSSYSPSKEAPNSSYDPRRMRSDKYYESSATVLPPSLSSSFRRATTESTVPRDTTKSQLFPQSPLRYRSIYPRFSSPNDSAAFGNFRDPIETQRATRPAGESRIFERSTPVQNYSGYLEDESRSPPRYSRFADSWSEDIGEDKSEEDAHRIGDSVENELERYMSRIPRLHLRADRLRSPPGEPDQEQNTSGDLLNVTLSDDDVEFSRTSATEFGNVAAGRSTREPENRGNFARESRANARRESASPEDAREARDARRDYPRLAADARRDYPKLVADARRDYPKLVADERRDYPKFDDGAARARDEDAGIASLARNAISPMDGNNETVAESRENRDREIDANTRGTRQARPNVAITDRDEASADLDSVPGITDTKLRLVSGEERDAGNHFREYAESLEPWNIGDLERRVQGSVITQDDLGPRFLLTREECNENPDAERRADLKADEFVGGAQETGSPPGEPDAKATPEVVAEHPVIANESKDRPIEDYTAEGSYDDQDRQADLADKRVDPAIEYGATEGIFTNEENALYSQQNYSEGANEQYQGQYQAENDPQNNAQYKGEPDGQQYSYDQQYQEGYNVSEEAPQYSTEPGQDYVADTNHPYVTDTNEQYVDGNNQPYVTDTNEQYVTDNNEAYVTDPNQQYVADNNEPYATDTNEQYVSINNEQFVTENNEQHVSDNNGQYVADPNEQYATDPNAQYVTDTNEQYVTGTNEPYVTDPNEQYVTDTNKTYVTDPNEQYVTDANEPYVTDPNEQYVTDPNEQYVTDPNEQYVTGANQEYPVDPNQYEEGVYSQDPNQEYPVLSDTNAAYPEAQEYAATDDQSALAENEAFVAETDDGRGYVQEPDKSVQETETKNELLSGDTLGQSVGQTKVLEKEEIPAKKTKDIIKSLLDSDTESTIERNVSNAESDFDFN